MKRQIWHLVLFILLISNSSFGQENRKRFETKAGYGYYQGFNTGLHYFYTDKLKVGFGIGSHFGLPPFENETHFNLQIENTLYFGNLNKQNVGRWYFNQQIMYWEQGPGSYRWKIVSLGLNIGKTIAITKRIGFDLESGPAFNMVIDIKNEPLAERSGWMWPVMYNGRVQLYYKF